MTAIDTLKYGRMWKSGLRTRPFVINGPGRRIQGAFLANVRTNKLGETWFDSSPPKKSLEVPGNGKDGDKDRKLVDERTLNLGKSISHFPFPYSLVQFSPCDNHGCIENINSLHELTSALPESTAIEILQSRMPTLLQSPLPSEILSPSISLILFPSTHPNLPTVRGRVAYIAALWTAPVAWGRLPSRNLRLQVLSERMIKASPSSPNGERLIVKWRTSSKSDEEARGAKEIKIQGGTTAVEDGEFCGLFLFEFDEKGRVQTHTIENADENLGADQTSSVITVTDWLLRKAKGQVEAQPGLAWQCGRLSDREGEK